MKKKIKEIDKNNAKIDKKHSHFEKKRNKKTKNQLNFENSVWFFFFSTFSN